MNTIRPTSARSGLPVRWMTRLLSIVVSCGFLLIMVLAVTNEDKPQGAALPVLTLLGLTMLASLAAWRWEKVGGLAVVVLAVCLGVAAYAASLAVGLGALSLLPALIYGAPFLILDVLFWMCSQLTASGSHHDRAPLPSVLRTPVAWVRDRLVGATPVRGPVWRSARWEPRRSLVSHDPPRQRDSGDEQDLGGRFSLSRLRWVLPRWWIIGTIPVIMAALVIGNRPCSWLDRALGSSGCLGVLEEHDGSVQSVIFSPGGALLASGSQDSTIRVWRVADRTLLHAMRIPTGAREAGYSHDVAFSPNGKTLASGSLDGTVKLWRAPQSATRLRSMKGYELYSWQVLGEWHFALVTGTNRMKTYDEIVSPEVSVRGLDSLQAELDQLPSGEQVFWLADRVSNVVLPPDEMMDEISTYCGQRGITLEIEPTGDEDSHLPTTVPVLTVVTSTGEHGIPLQEPEE